MLEKLFINILQVSLTTSLMIAIMFLLAPLTYKKYSARWKYFVWLVLAIRLIIPISFSISEAPIQLDNVVIYEEPSSNSSNLELATNDTPMLPDTTPVVSTAAPSKPFTISIFQVLSIIWLIGALVSLIANLLSYYTFKKELHRWCIPSNEEALKLFEKIKDEIKLKKNISLFYCKKVKSPMMLGIIHPTVLMPFEQYNEVELYLILKHELTHFKNNDIHTKFLMMFVKSLHWFNPLVYFMNNEFNRVIEMACDEAVIEGQEITYKKRYIETILSSMKQSNDLNFSLNTNLNGGTKIMKKRFKNILQNGKKQKGILTCALLISVSLMSGALIAFSPNPDYKPEKITHMMAETMPLPALEKTIIKDLEIPDEFAVTTKYYYNYVDFNNDGVNEIFVQLVGPYTSGTGGDTGIIFEQTDKGLQPVQTFTLIHNPIIISNNMTNGSRDIIVQMYGGGAKTQFVTMKFNGKAYSTVNDSEALKSLDDVSGTAIISNDFLKDIEEGKGLYLKTEQAITK